MAVNGNDEFIENLTVHLGRMNTCSQPWRNETDFKEFYRLLAEEINNLYPF